MSHNPPPALTTSTANADAPATAATIAADAPLRSNPVGTAGLVAAGLLLVAHVAFQLVTMNAVLAGDSLGTNMLVTLVQPMVMAALVILTVVLGTIAALQRGRLRLAAGITLGVGVYALVSMLVGFLVGVGYSLA
jgi:hypothetical protein